MTTEAEVHVVPTTITVSRTVKVDGVETESGEVSEVIEVHKFATEPAYARISIPIKKSKDFKSVGITVGVDRPCYVEELSDGMEEAYQIATDFLLSKLPKLLDALTKL